MRWHDDDKKTTMTKIKAHTQQRCFAILGFDMIINWPYNIQGNRIDNASYPN